MAYEPNPGMYVNRRNAKNLPVGPDGKREWSHDLLRCGGDTACLLAWFLPCVLFSQVKNRFSHLEDKGYPDPNHGGGWCTSHCMLHLALNACGVGACLQVRSRRNTRERYSIEGGLGGDCFAAWCCPPCELEQEARELELEESTYGPLMRKQ